MSAACAPPAMEPTTPAKANSSLRTLDKHAQRILTQINKMRHQLEFCDVQIQIGDSLFGVHKLVLSASSPYFAALFAGGMKESMNDVVQIQGVESRSFEVLLDFIYTGSLNISAENVQELMTAADMLQLSHVVELCCDFLKEQIEPGNCVGFFQFSEQLACHPLLEFTESYIHAHFTEVQVGDEFPTLTKEQLIYILRSEELSIEDEYQVFCAAMTWVQREIGTRKRHVVEVLEPVRFSLLPPQRLQKYIEGITDFSLRVALQTLLREYCEPSRSSKDQKVCSFLQTARVQPRRKARKFLYAIGEKDSMIFDCVECYNPVSMQWSAVSSMNQPRCGLGVCACHGAIYSLGGWIGAEIGNSIERFSPEENAWQIVGSMAVPRYYFGCCEMQGLIYVVGGISQEGTELCSAEVYDPIARRWKALPPMSTCRAYLGVAALNDCLYVVGGWNESEEALSTVEKFSFEEERWVEVAPIKIPRAGVSVVSVNGLLYAAGGRATGQDFSAPVTSDCVEVYNPHTDTWTEIGSMITSRCEGGLAVL
ncbi:hypothetical protein FKM82_001971 [Ascaphus truei]